MRSAFSFHGIAELARAIPWNEKAKERAAIQAFIEALLKGIARLRAIPVARTIPWNEKAKERAAIQAFIEASPAGIDRLWAIPAARAIPWNEKAKERAAIQAFIEASAANDGLTAPWTGPHVKGERRRGFLEAFDPCRVAFFSTSVRSAELLPFFAAAKLGA